MEKIRIKLVIFDVDGTLTDGMFHVCDNGTTFKSFDSRDFYGMQKLVERYPDIRLMFLSGSNDKCIITKANQLPDKVRDRIKVVTGCENKLLYLAGELGRGEYSDINISNVAYMGDEQNDLECMKAAGYTACPYYSDVYVRIESNLDIPFKAGKEGAARYFLEYLMSSENIDLGEKNE